MSPYLVERLAELRRHLDLRDLEQLPGFRKVLIHEYVTLDLERAVSAVRRLEPVERFVAIVDAAYGGPDEPREGAGSSG